MSSVSSQVPKGVRGRGGGVIRLFAGAQGGEGGGGVIRLFAGAQGGEGGGVIRLFAGAQGGEWGVSSVSSQAPKGVRGGVEGGTKEGWNFKLSSGELLHERMLSFTSDLWNSQNLPLKQDPYLLHLQSFSWRSLAFHCNNYMQFRNVSLKIFLASLF